MNTEKKEFYTALFVPALTVMILWSIKLIEVLLGTSFSNYGLEPHTLKGLIGIVTMPLLHADFTHLSSNTIALFLVLFGLYFFYKSFANKLFLLIYIMSGFATWIIGSAGTIHIGASGIVYALAWFHILSGFIKKNKQQAAFGLLVIFLYGGVVWGIFPMFQASPNISWQGHMGGAITGVVLSILYRKKGLQTPLSEKEDDEISDDDPYWLEENIENDETKKESEN